MAEAKKEEPSMEEILASIRRIIAEDEEPKTNAAAPGAAEEVLELTEIVDESAVEPEDPPEVGHNAASEAEPAPMSEPPARAKAAPAEQSATDRLVSTATAAASVAALSQLAQMSAARDQRRDTSLPIGHGQLTIEELVRDLLKPMLRDWLDSNLADLVTRLVKEEIARMVREAQG
jgi:cell pole-organizing protein PopZ